MPEDGVLMESDDGVSIDDMLLDDWFIEVGGGMLGGPIPEWPMLPIPMGFCLGSPYGELDMLPY